MFHEIKDGKITGLLKDVAYQMRTPEFWNSLDLLGGREQLLRGRLLLRRQGPALPVQRRVPRLPAARFRKVNVINTGRAA